MWNNDRRSLQYFRIFKLHIIYYVYMGRFKNAYPKSLKYVKNMSKRRFLKPRLFKQHRNRNFIIKSRSNEHIASRFLPSEWQSKKKVAKSFDVPARWASTGGNAKRNLANFATFFLECHFDSKNLEAMCSFGRNFFF